MKNKDVRNITPEASLQRPKGLSRRVGHISP